MTSDTIQAHEKHQICTMKIPKPVKRGDAWRICVTYEKTRYTSTHDTENQAKEWAARKIISLKDSVNDPAKSKRHTLREAIIKYNQIVAPKLETSRSEINSLNKFMRDFPKLADSYLDELNSEMFADWREDRLDVVVGSTVNRDMNRLSSVFTYCVYELKWLAISPLKGVRRPESGPHRDRRISQHEINLILEHLECDPTITPETHPQEVGIMFLLAIETGMRTGEMCNLAWKHVHLTERYVHLPKTKNKDKRNVALSATAESLIRLMIDVDKVKVFTVDALDKSKIFIKARDAAAIDDLHFHDSRHEAITRLARKLDILDLARMIGHRDIKSLMIYYNATATEIASRLD